MRHIGRRSFRTVTGDTSVWQKRPLCLCACALVVHRLLLNRPRPLCEVFFSNPSSSSKFSALVRPLVRPKLNATEARSASTSKSSSRGARRYTPGPVHRHRCLQLLPASLRPQPRPAPAPACRPRGAARVGGASAPAPLSMTSAPRPPPTAAGSVGGGATEAASETRGHAATHNALSSFASVCV